MLRALKEQEERVAAILLRMENCTEVTAQGVLLKLPRTRMKQIKTIQMSIFTLSVKVTSLSTTSITFTD